MIHFVVRNPLPPQPFLAGFGRELASVVRVLTYRELFAARRVPAGVWIFTDPDRLSPARREAAAHVWQQLEASGRTVRLLNHPLRTKRRQALLQALHAAGMNDFEAWSAAEARSPRRYPVFVRVADDHAGPRTSLLFDAAELEREIQRLETSWRPRQQLLVVEFCAEPDAGGVFRKYGAFRVGERVFPNHLLFGSEWLVKRRSHDGDAARLAEERRFLEANPHEPELRRAFDIAGIEYGRADYAIVGGRVQIYEINTNPTIMGANVPQDAEGLARKQHFARTLVAALRALERPEARPPPEIRLTSNRGLLARLRRFLWKVGARVFGPPA